MKQENRTGTRTRIVDGQTIIIDEELLIFELLHLLESAEKFNTTNETNEADGELNSKYMAYLKEVKSMMDDNDFFLKLVRLSRFMNRMEIIQTVKEGKISITTFTNKYGQKYLKAKSAFPQYVFENGKKKVKYKSISCHVGKLEDFKDGVNDEEVQKIARKGIMRKAIDTIRVQFIEK